jgi:hypothetical protein
VQARGADFRQAEISGADTEEERPIRSTRSLVTDSLLRIDNEIADQTSRHPVGRITGLGHRD